MNPMLIAVDADNDNVMLYKYKNEHVLDFIEPIVLAVLAAPPCEEGIRQEYGRLRDGMGVGDLRRAGADL